MNNNEIEKEIEKPNLKYNKPLRMLWLSIIIINHYII